jgi:hypothetical protein
MGKKNTLLYMEENIVKAAKVNNMNLSIIAEEAIKKKLFGKMSMAERVSFDSALYLETLRDEGRCYRMPVTILSLKIKNIGHIRDLDVSFSNFNIIKARYGSGNNILIKLIAHVFGFNDFDFKNILSTNHEYGEININAESNLFINLKRNESGNIVEDKHGGCILLDDAGDYLDENCYRNFLIDLKGIYSQVIITTNRDIDRIGLDFDYKSFNMDDFLHCVFFNGGIL